jgi:hypothetical protein
MEVEDTVISQGVVIPSISGKKRMAGGGMIRQATDLSVCSKSTKCGVATAVVLRGEAKRQFLKPNKWILSSSNDAWSWKAGKEA